MRAPLPQLYIAGEVLALLDNTPDTCSLEHGLWGRAEWRWSYCRNESRDGSRIPSSVAGVLPCQTTC